MFDMSLHLLLEYPQLLTNQMGVNLELGSGKDDWVILIIRQGARKCQLNLDFGSLRLTWPNL